MFNFAHYVAANIGKIASKDAARFQLNAVQLAETDSGWTATATDGRALIRVTGKNRTKDLPDMPGFDADKNGGRKALVSVADLKAFGKRDARGPDAGNSVACVIADGEETAQLARPFGQVQTVKCLGGGYPDVDQIIPQGVPTVRIGFNARLLSDALRAIDAMAEQRSGGSYGGHYATVTVDITDAKSAVKITAHGKDGEEITGVVMPVLID